MLAHATTPLKCEILRVSHFHGPSAQLFVSRTLSSSRVQAFISTSNLNRPSKSTGGFQVSHLLCILLLMLFENLVKDFDLEASQ